MFEGDLRDGAVHEGEKRLLHDDIESDLLFAHDLDIGGERPDDAIREEDAGESADERRADQVAEKLGRLVEGAHRLDDAENGRDDAKSRKRLRHRGKCAIGLELVARDGLDLLVHQRLDLMGAGIADEDQAGIVANEVGQVLIGENALEVGEDR